MNHPTQSLQIHVHKMDGSLETFTQSETSMVNHLLNQFRPAQIFAREKVLIAGDNSLTSFPVHQVVRIDLVSEHLSHWIIPQGIVEAVEVTETEFQALLQNPELLDRWDQARTQETSVVTFLDLEMAGQKPLFLAMEVNSDAHLESAASFPSLLTVPTLCFRMRTGGIAALNLLHLMRFTLFPLPQQTPVDTWFAHPAKNPHFKRTDRGFGGPALGRSLPSPLQPNGQTNLDPSQSSPSETEPKMEGTHQ
jgi:hypothetical protein